MACRDVAAVGHALNRPNTCSATHSLDYAFKLCLSVVCNEGHEFKFDQADDVLSYLADPSAFKAAAAPSGGDGGEAEAAPVEEVEEEADADGIVMNLGGDDDDAW